ncbi:MAG: DNA-directed RNA polymerase subunit H [Candidatus Micrarchaeota archaeon]
MDNELVPFHEIVPEEEAAQVLAKLGVSKDQLPVILPDDPVAQELQAKSGDLLRIYRKSPTAGQTIYYRVVE